MLRMLWLSKTNGVQAGAGWAFETSDLCERCKPSNPMMLMVLQVGALLEARACVDALAQKGQGLRNGPFCLEAYLLVTEKSRKSPEKQMFQKWMWRANDFLHMPITDCLKESLLWCSLRRNLRDVLGSVREIGWKRFAFDEIVQYLVQVR